MEPLIIDMEEKVFKQLQTVADELGYPCYVVGGYVRDHLMGLPNDDIDIVVVGSGPKMAKAFAKSVGSSVQIFENFGTAKVDFEGLEIEFVGARKESYQRGSRNPIVEDGTLIDDLTRRDFTINAMAICLNKDSYGQVVDLFGGMDDLRKGILKTPTDPEVTFNDDPLRILRCIRFATRFGFNIEKDTWISIIKNKERLKIITQERITTELNKTLSQSDEPGRGITLLKESGLLDMILPEVAILDRTDEELVGQHHKNNFWHTVQVLNNVALKSSNLWLRWAALLHDIGKEPTKRFDKEVGWTFYGHEHAGAAMIEGIFRRLKQPLGKELEYVKKIVSMHMRPSMISTHEATDSAVRRLLADAGEDFDDLMILCESDLTTKNDEKRARIGQHFIRLHSMVDDLRARDYVRLFQPVIGGSEIMEILGLRPGRAVGDLKQVLKDAVLDGSVPNEEEPLIKLLKQKASEMGLYANP